MLIPAVYIAANYGLTTLYWTRSLVRLEGMIVNMFFAYYLIHQSPWKMFVNVLPVFVSCIAMDVVAYILLSFNDSIICSFIWVILSGITYVFFLSLFPNEKQLLQNLYETGKHKLFHNITSRRSI